MSISFTEAFDYYKPTVDRLPEHLAWRVGHVEQQANWLIKERTQEELKTILVKADEWLRLHVPFTSKIMKKFAARLDEDGGLYTTDSMGLFHSRDELDLADIKGVTNLSWSEFFAILALAKLGMVITIGSKPFMYDPKPKDFIVAELQRDQSGFYARHKDECLLESVEAIAYAQAIALEEDKKLKDIARGRAAGETKKQSYHALKQYVIDRYNEADVTVSDRVVAKEIYDQMPDSLKSGFNTVEPENTIKSWFLKYRRGELKDITPYPPKRT